MLLLLGVMFEVLLLVETRKIISTTRLVVSAFVLHVKDQVLRVGCNSTVSKSNLKETSSILLCHKTSHPLAYAVLPVTFLQQFSNIGF